MTPYQKDFQRYRPTSYEDYIRNAGTDPIKKRLESERRIKQDSHFRDTAYGAFGNSLATSGLINSGYAEYLERRTLGDEKRSAIGELYRTEADNLSLYTEYINNYEELQEKLKQSFISSLTERGVSDFDRALALAAGTGLNEENAILAAREGVALSKKAAVKRAIDYIRTKGLSYASAINYLKAQGFSQGEAADIAKDNASTSEENYNYYSNLDADSYFDEVKNQASETNKKEKKQ